jgi:hypothetical protein
MMKDPARLAGVGCVAVMGAAAVWNCGAAALALHVWFRPVPPGSMKLDAMTEIWLIAGVLNKSLPIFAVAFISAVVLAARRKAPALVIVVMALLFLASLAPAVVFWQELARIHGPEINLWKDHIWWHIGQ